MMASLLFVIKTWIMRRILENMGWTCIVASMSEHLRFDGRRTNLRKLGEVNIVYPKIGSDSRKIVTEKMTIELDNVLEGPRHLVGR